MKFILTAAVFTLLMIAGAPAQDPLYPELVKAENRLKAMFEELYEREAKEVDSLLNEIQGYMEEVLMLDGAMEFPWSKLDRIGVRTTEDGKVRIFTWHVMDHPEKYRYFGFIQVQGKRDKLSLFPLLNNGLAQRGIYRLDQSTSNWYGKLYYQVLTHQVKRKTYYTLLGMDFNNSLSNIKFVEMIQIQRNKPVFVKNGFSNGRDVVDRVVLEYSDQVSMSVRYDRKLEMITYDHLVPMHPVYQDQYEFYGPDGSFDGLRFTDGTWMLQEDIDARIQN